MKYENPNLDIRVREVLDANFPEWVWNLKKGDRIAVTSYAGSWNPPGTRYWYEKIFICIAGNKIWYQDKTNPSFISYTVWEGEIKPIEELAAIEAELLAYREANPNWESLGM